LRRYGLAELLAIVATLLGGWTTLVLTDNIVLAAFAATWAENLAYYGTIIVRDLRRHQQWTARRLLRTVRNLVLEFGPAELLDSLLIRPTTLTAAFALIPMPALAAIAGKFAADILFYLPTITSYELLRRRAPAGHEEHQHDPHLPECDQPRRA
jgi:hypothetical protein